MTGCFQGSQLKSVELPAGVSIGDSAFKGCVSLQSVTFKPPKYWMQLIRPMDLGGWSIFEGCSSLQSLHIPNNVTYVGTKFAKDCTSLTDISLPDSLLNIASFAFQNTPAFCIHYNSGIQRMIGEDALPIRTSCTLAPTIAPTSSPTVTTTKPKPMPTIKPTTKVVKKPTTKRKPSSSKVTHSPSRRPSPKPTRTTHSPSRKPTSA